jgi:translation initiation factor 2 beta subunit (eIF-2beta)/eIF-5
MNNKKIFYTERHLNWEIYQLTAEFERACGVYRSTLNTRESNRSKKELSRSNTRGTHIHKFQCNFAWILNEITAGPPSGITDGLEAGRTLVEHIENISNN